jgi:hypothetical protein
MGPGDHPFSKFGHIAIVVREAGRDEVFNYGTFTFDSPWLIVDFLKGRLRYWLSVDSLSHTVDVYRRERRSVLLQELALPSDKRRELVAFLRENARPENKYYRYDYYLDNCSTRVRDALDRAADGRIRAASTGPGRLTFREHTARMVSADFPLFAALDIVMGPAIDQPIREWDETFLPEELARVTRDVTVMTAAGDVPLVSREVLLAATDRAGRREKPPSYVWQFGATGTGAGATMALLSKSQKRLFRGLGVAMQAAIGVVCAVLGSVFAILWAFTDHVVAHRNENLLLCSPLALGLALLAPGVARGRPSALRTARGLTWVLAALATLDLAIKLAFRSTQDNGRWIAFFLPLWTALALAASARARPRAG